MKFRERVSEIFLTIFCIVILIIALPFVLLWLLWELIYTPIGYMKFKKSRYQKDFPQKYKWLRTPHTDNEVYTIVKENDLPIDYLKFYEDYELPGYFLYKDILLVFSEPFFFDEKKELWLFWPNNQDDTDEENEEVLESDEEENTDDCLTVEATEQYFIEQFKQNISDRTCNKVIFFYQIKKTEKLYGVGAVEIMRNTDGFILYEKGKLKQAIMEYIEHN